MDRGLVSIFLLLTLSSGFTGLNLLSAQEKRPEGEFSHPIQMGTIFKIGGRSEVPEGAFCHQILSISSDLDIAGKVEGRVISLWGDVKLASTAQVDGGLIIIGGRLKSEPGAKVSGKILRFSTVEALSEFISLMSGIPRHYWGNIAWISWKIILFVCMLILQVILLAVFPKNIETMARCVAIKPIGSSLLGLIIFLALPPISFMLIFSLVGIPLALMLWAVLVSAAIFGKIGLFVALGNILLQTERLSLLSVILGYTIYRVLTLLPVVGKPIFIVITFLAIGICIRTGFGLKEPYRRGTRPPEYKHRR